ncbi:hydrolase [Gallaecimonas mangrovi]|uniref:hydrolase n=1 Tax=Gallaecimonas mangrovi TaxID=2291597 RepID=UPI000E205662|nr:hydrolase [Gallaecimonas mangrovi]
MISESDFSPAIGLGNCHAQTIFPTLKRSKPWITCQCEWLATPDGDELALLTPKPLSDDACRPLVMVLHGLEGSVNSPYVQGLMAELIKADMQVAVMHFRGCGGVPNKLPRAYHSGESGDPRWLAAELKRRYPNTPLMAVGYSLGGNVLLKWLGEDAQSSPLKAAVAVSPPMDLLASSRHISRGLSKVYQRHLLNSLRQSLERKAQNPALAQAMPNVANKALFKDFATFDHAFTAPLHGFKSGRDYYQKASSKPLLASITQPTLIIHALDDPFISPEAIPADHELSSSVTLELSRHGGHVGFIAGSLWRPRYWLESRIPAFLGQFRD